MLLSGGMDSATCLAIAKAEGYELFALSFRYGQRHSVELDCARRLARSLGVARHLIMEFDLSAIGGSALTEEIEVPKDRSSGEMAEGIPVTYVPARNTIFLSFALAWAETLGASEIIIGVNALDYSGYPDCRPEYIEAYQRMAGLATRDAVERDRKVRIKTPLIDLTKAEIIARGLELGVDYSMTSSCYDPLQDGLACGRCDACALRLKGFEKNGVEDPALYVAEVL